MLEKLNKQYRENKLIPMPVIPVVFATERKMKGEKYPQSFYINCQTSERSFVLEDVIDTSKPYRLIYKKNKAIKGFTFAYDKELKLVVCFIAMFSMKALKEGETRQWEEIGRFYVDKDKHIYFKGDLNSRKYGFSHFFQSADKYKGQNGIDRLGIESMYNADNFCHPTNIPYQVVGKDFAPLWKLFPKMVNLQKNVTIPLATVQNFLDFLKYKEPVQKSTPKQKKVNELVGYKLKDLKEYKAIASEIVAEYKVKNCKIYYYIIDCDIVRFAVLEKVNHKEPIVCIRNICVSVDNLAAYETYRVYFGKKHKIIACKKNNAGKFVYLPIYKDPSMWQIPLVKFNRDEVKGTMLEYFSCIMDEIPQDLQGYYIWALAQNPIFEQLYKMGYKVFVNKIFQESQNRNLIPERILQYMCGKIDKSAETIYGTLGMNMYQMDVLFNNEDYWNTPFTTLHQIVKMVKCILSGKICSYYLSFLYDDPTQVESLSIRDIDRNTFQFVINLIHELLCAIPNNVELYHLRHLEFTINIISIISNVWGVKQAIKCGDKVKSLFELTLKNERENEQKWRSGDPNRKMTLYRDYLEMVKATGYEAISRPWFNTFDDIERMHDDMMAIFELKKQTIQREKFDKVVLKVKKFEYSTEEYQVQAPNKPEDFVKEGQALCHCVQSYLQKVIDGYTNIMFIRKSEQPDKPFFTVEISNNGLIEQIHGLQNRNLDTEPELIPFVHEWCKKVGLKSANFNKIR